MAKNKNEPVHLKLEVIIIPVSDVDRAKAFYEKLGFRLDGDFNVNDKLRIVQLTPPHSEASIIFGKGVASAKPGSIKGLVLAVAEIEAARAELIARGAEVSEVFHYAGFPFNGSVANARISGPDPDGRTYFTFASFEDPDGNGWLLQEVTKRAPGREWEVAAKSGDVAKLAELLRETEEHHGDYEKTHGKHQWSNWYAPYLNARQNGSNPEQAAAAADRYMEEIQKTQSRDSRNIAAQ